MTIIASPRAAHQVSHQAALAAGLRRHGVEVVMAQGGPVQTEYVACWGWRHGKALREDGRQVLVMERGYIGDRFAWTSLAWNGLNGRGQVHVPDDGGERLRKHHPDALKPMSPDGQYVLIAGQVPGDAALQGRDLNPWYAEQVQRVQHIGLPVRFRPHPLAHKRGRVLPVPGAETDRGELGPSLADAALVVTYNSNTGVDALLAGKQVTAEDEGSMIWYRPMSREAWAARLAWRQWTLEEISSGAAWDTVRHGH